MLRILIAILCVLWLAPLSGFGADAETALKELMGPDVYKATGMERLTPEERRALAEWMGVLVATERERAQEEALPSGEPSFGLEQVAERIGGLFRNSPDRIESRILGDFRGWNGNTIFRLENGQVWQQAAAGTFFYRTEEPVAVIRRGVLGTYLLQVQGKGTTVRVRRIE